MTTLLRLYVLYQSATLDRQTRAGHEHGEVTAQTAMIVLLVVAAITAGGIIAAKIVGNANNVPSP